MEIDAQNVENPAEVEFKNQNNQPDDIASCGIYYGEEKDSRPSTSNNPEVHPHEILGATTGYATDSTMKPNNNLLNIEYQLQQE